MANPLIQPELLYGSILLKSKVASEVQEKFLTQADLTFDYTKLSPEARTIVEQHTFEIKSLLRQTAQELINIGKKLIEVKEQLGHGNFGCWLKAEFGWGTTTAWKLMKVAEAFKFSQCENLDISTSAIYLLAAPSTSHAVRQEALKLAETGEKITYTKVKTIIARHRETAESKSSCQEVSIPRPEKLNKSELIHSPFPMPLLSEASQENSSYSKIANTVLQFLGEIDLHLCNNNYIGNEVPALIRLTEDNGLAHPWHGRFFINLPETDALNAFVHKLCTEFESKRITEALALFPSQTNTQWFHRLRQYPRCFLHDRLSCLNSCDRELYPAVIFYLGQESQEGLRKFSTAFQRLGDIFTLVE